MGWEITMEREVGMGYALMVAEDEAGEEAVVFVGVEGATLMGTCSRNQVDTMTLLDQKHHCHKGVITMEREVGMGYALMVAEDEAGEEAMVFVGVEGATLVGTCSRNQVDTMTLLDQKHHCHKGMVVAVVGEEVVAVAVAEAKISDQMDQSSHWRIPVILAIDAKSHDEKMEGGRDSLKDKVIYEWADFKGWAWSNQPRHRIEKPRRESRQTSEPESIARLQYHSI
ncbi:hypothetical protein ACLOJK_031195 [Asimina triloba]